MSATILTGHVLRAPRLSNNRGRPPVRCQFMIRCSDDASQLVRICCSDRIADYAVRFLQAGDHIRAIGTMKERTWTTARGERASALRLFVDDLSAIREPA